MSHARKVTLLGVLAVLLGLTMGNAWPHLLGRPGFQLKLISKENRVDEQNAAALSIPDVLPAPPPGTTLEATGFIIIEAPDTYDFSPESMVPLTFQIANLPVFNGPTGERPLARKRMVSYKLEAGAHAIRVRMPNVPAGVSVVLSWRRQGERRLHTLGTVGGEIFVTAPSAWRLVPVLRQSPPLLATILFALLLLWARRTQTLRSVWLEISSDRFCKRVVAGFAVFMVTIPILWPLLEPGYIVCHEGESFFLRFVEFNLAIRDGVPMGRWWGDPVFGRGIPFLGFYAPLLYFLVGPFLLLGVDEGVLIRMVSAGLIVVGAAATYHLCRRYASRIASLLGAALFVSAPYLHTDVYVRGDLPESLGFACFPLALLALDWALDAPLERPRLRIAVVTFAMFLLGSCHNITAYFSLFFVGAWLGGRRLVGLWQKGSLRLLLIGGALTFAMCVFYMVPAVVERPLVNLQLLQIGYYSFFKHYIGPHSIWFRDIPDTAVEMRLYYGIAATLAVLGGIVAVIRFRKTRPRAFFLGAMALCVFAVSFGMVTQSLGALVYPFFPLAKFVGFPWRNLLFGACAASLAGAAAFDLLCPTNLRRPLAAITIVLVVGIAAQSSGSPERLLRIHPDVPQFLRHLPTDFVTAVNEYQPNAVRRSEPPFDEVAHLVGPGQILNRTRTASRYHVEVDTPEQTTLELNAHRFPGWQATDNGTPTEIVPPAQNGLVRVQLSPGKHVVDLHFARTPLRWACDVVSLLAFLVALGLLLSSLRAPASPSGSERP